MARALLSSLLVLAAVAVADAAPERPPFEVTLEISKDRCRLLEELTVEVDVRSLMTKKLELRPIRLATVSVVLRLTEGEKTFRLARIYGRTTSAEIVLEHQPAVGVARNKKISGTFKITAIRPGKYEVVAEYHGAEELEMVESKPVTLTVDAPPDGKRMVALITTGAGTMTAELDPDRAFNTVHEFVVNSRSRYYGKPMVFFRVVKGFMAQVGDKTNTGGHHAGHLIPAEFNDLKHEKGVLSMARATPPDSGGAQFFVMHGTSAGLDGKYAAFGKVVDGLEVIDKICDAEVTQNPNSGEMSKPKDPVSLDQIAIVVK